MKYKCFREYCELREGWFDNIFGNKKPSPEQEPDIHVSDPPYKKHSDSPYKNPDKITDTDWENEFSGWGKGSLWQALKNFKTKDGRIFSDDAIRNLSQSDQANKEWNEKYKARWLSAEKQPETQQLIAQQSFKLMRIPESLLIIPPKPKAIEKKLVPIPEMDKIKYYAQQRLKEDSNLTLEVLKKEIMSKFPGIMGKYAKPSIVAGQITRMLKRLIKPSIFRPEPEEDDPNILSFSKFNKSNEFGKTN